MSKLFNYDEKILKLWINTTTSFSRNHKNHIISILHEIPMNSYKNLNIGFLKNVLLLKTYREIRMFRNSVNLLEFCNYYYVLYLCKQILNEYKGHFGFNVFARFLRNSKKIYNKNMYNHIETLNKLIYT